MSTHKYIDRICLAAALLSLLVALLFVNGEALGLQPASRVQGYETRLFDTARVHTIDIVMDGWDDFIETCENEEYAACAAVIDGEAYKNVGIRAKGNTSLSTVSAMDSSRYSFKLEFDHYDSGKTYYGLDKLCLNNIIQDNTYMKDYLTYRMMGEFGVSAPLCSFVFITVNGEEWGLYLAVEGVEESFLQRNYGSQYGMLYKPDSMSFGGGRGNGRDFDMEDLSQLEQFAPPGRSGVFSQQGEEPPAMDEMPGGAMQGRQRPDMPVQEGGKGEGAPGGRGGPGEQDGTGPDSFPQAENRPEGSERPSGRMDAMGMEMPDGVPPVGNGPQDGRGAASDSQALLPLLVSVLALLAGILSAWRYRRNGRRKTPPGRKSAAQTQENWACSRR